MSDSYVVTLKWGYPYDEAVGAGQTEVSLQSPTTVRLLLDDMIQRYSALGTLLEQNGEGEFTALVCAEKNTEKRILTMHHQVAEACTLQVIPPLSGG